MALRLLLTIPFTLTQCIKIDPASLCEIKYDKQGFTSQIDHLEKTKAIWGDFKGVQLDEQVATYQGKPVFKITGDTLSEHLRGCSKKAGTLVEFFNEKQQKDLNKIMRKLKLEKILVYLTYTDNQLLWPASGVGFQYNVLDAPARSRKNAKTFKGLVPVSYTHLTLPTKRIV